MTIIDRKKILDNFYSRLRDAKRQNIREVRFSMGELDDLGFVIWQLMIEKIENLEEILKENKDGGGF